MTPYYYDGGVTIYHGDCRDVLANWRWPADVVVTDPPYGTGGWRRSGSGAGSNPSASLVREAWDDGAVDWLGLTDLPIVTFWPAAHTARLLARAAQTGRTKHRCLYMRKRDPKPQVDNRIRWSVEPIWVLSADGFLLYGGDDVCEASTPRAGRDSAANGHPYQKPEYVMEWLLSKLPPNVMVIDPFMGSGTTLAAAKRLGIKAIGIEQDEQWCRIARGRLGQGSIFGEATA